MPRARAAASSPRPRVGATPSLAATSSSHGRARASARATAAARITRPAVAASRTSRPAASAAERRRITQELRALAHPLRLRLLQFFAGEPRTTMQVAVLMGEPPTRLYHHVNALERAGILELARTRPVRGTIEKYFKVARKQIGVSRPDETTPSSRAALRGLTEMVFEEARTELLAALAEPGRFTQQNAPIALRMLLQVPPSRMKRVRGRIVAMVKAIKRELKDCNDPAAQHWALTLGFAPSAPTKRPE